MTRKCVICKETNYKNAFSFFSAPKDPETRQKWSDAMGIENYVVCDDTYVCSKHFTHGDIITHWVSGVPPHVVTIKFKKCRLRPGAVPSTSCELMNSVLSCQDEDDEDLAVNRGQTIVRKVLNSESEIVFLPREEGTMENSDDGESQTEKVTYEKHAMAECKVDSDYTVLSVTNHETSEDTNNSALMENPDNELEEMATIVNLQGDENFVYAKNDVSTEIVYMQNANALNLDCVQEEVELVPENKSLTCLDYGAMKTEMTSAEDETSMDMWDSLSNDNTTGNDSKPHQSYSIKSNPRECDNVEEDGANLLNEKMDDDYEDDDNAMLFEDLLDVYTEVQLPTGWSSMVTSKGHATTVVYVFMGLTKNGMPYTEKQVFLKSDMKLRCGAANKELNPQMHNLVREGRSRIVYTLSDVEEFLEEFDQRIVCEGCAGEKTRPEDIENSVAYRDVSAKWRHIQCPIIVNNGSSRCSKCSTLDSSLTRSRKRRHNAEMHEFASALMKKEKTIRVLHRLLRKLNKRNQRFESMRESIEGKFETVITESNKVLLATVEKLEMPKIQKIMVKECLRSSAKQTGKSKYSETWVFLCLLLYIESPRMYRYMLQNKYMTLPSMKIIRRYLHQIKTDKQFYNLFQRTVEPFHPSTRESEKEPT